MALIGITFHDPIITPFKQIFEDFSEDAIKISPCSETVYGVMKKNVKNKCKCNVM